MKSSKVSISIKLWKYFVLFAAITLVLLWMLQTVFLQAFYEQMQYRNVEKAAAAIAENIKNGSDYSFIEDIAYNNSMQVILTDISGNILYRADEYSSAYRSSQNPYRENSKQGWELGMYRYVPDDYPEFLQRLLESEDRNISYKINGTDNSINLICGKIVQCSEGDLAIYINTPIGAVQSTVEILRTMLLAVTGVLLLVGFALAYFFASRFAKPVSAISEQAKKLVNDAETVAFEKGFCKELDELSDALNETAKSLARLENFRKELLANVTHDLKTPLTLIGGYAEKIEDISCEDVEETRKDASIIKREAKRLTLLVNDILDYSVLQSGSAAFDFQPVNIGELAEKILVQFGVMCDRGDIIFQKHIEDGLFVSADERRLSQVFYNLIVNAVVHAGNDKIVKLTIYCKESTVRVEILDHGNGITQEDISHIWDRYFTSRERKRTENGTGLGLSIVKEILDTHSARYGVISQKGNGSCFWFEFACLQKAEQ